MDYFVIKSKKSLSAGAPV